ncbi:short-chain dehydrogenase/reductase 2b [Lolium perenne]|uniref:short-chain dehydrogenase/reductase 2b n=1 Tax=Lolium perenne TaxID=4522 RepID=UPI0021F61185|nr:short-chain dehydrogenase/reductase 2b-like [Lolium perenne]
MRHHVVAAAAVSSTSVRSSLTPLRSPLHQPRASSRQATFPAACMEKKPASSVAAAAASPASSVHRLEKMSHDHEAIPKRLAVVTGGNRGIGLEVCRQLALEGVTVILTARDEKQGEGAVEYLRRESNLSNIIFHQLDILDSSSRASLARHIESTYGKLDILVNNAGVGGVAVDQDGLRALNIDPKMWLSGEAGHLIQSVIVQTYDEAVKCLNTNYYGLKWTTEALLPLLKRSTSGARIINTSSLRSELQRMPNEVLRESLRDADSWDEARIEAMLSEFLEDMKNERLEEAGWPLMLPAYSMSKMVVNLYTRILARRHPEMRVNCVHPGFVKTEINWNTGVIPPEEGARGAVMLALVPEDGPTGCYFDQTKMGVAW